MLFTKLECSQCTGELLNTQVFSNWRRLCQRFCGDEDRFGFKKGCLFYRNFDRFYGKGILWDWVSAKGLLDKRVDIAPWVLHDLRRTARSLMSRAGVRPDIAERVLGHVITGVEGVYDRHQYVDEKRDALARLAKLVERILDPPADNVVELAGRG